MSDNSSENIAALIGSRICHDLISPIGAVNNGLELLQLSGVPDSPEMALIANSAANASSRISLFRLAFGAASELQSTGAEEFQRIWSEATTDRKLTLDWQGPESFPRTEAQVVLLAMLCLDKALPHGGTITPCKDNKTWSISAIGDVVKQDDQHWGLLTGQSPLSDVPPSHVQFLLLPQLLNKLGRHCDTRFTDAEISLTF